MINTTQKKKRLETGEAKVILSVENGLMTMRHGSCDMILHQAELFEGQWDKIIDFIKDLMTDSTLYFNHKTKETNR